MASSLNKSSPYNKYEIRKRDPDPKSCALLVIDVQNYFSSIAKPILSNLSTTIQLCRNASIPVIFTRHCHKSPADYGMLYEYWNGDLIHDGTPEAELIPTLDRKPEDMVVEKNTYSAFRNTHLEEKLTEMGIKEVIVTGVMTNLCCETTAREAFVRGFRVFFSADATATLNSELHEATLKNMAYGFAYLVDCQRLRDALTKFWIADNSAHETTAREAFVRGFGVFFSPDATATLNSELHEATLKNMAYGFAYLVDYQRL